MSIFRPGSVLQLVLAGFLVALVPLCIAAIFTLQTLDELAERSRENSSLLVEVTRLAQEIEGDLVGLERRAGQYYALEDPELAGLFGRERIELLRRLENLQERTRLKGPVISRLIDSIDKLTLVPSEITDSISEGSGLSSEHGILNVFESIAEQGRDLQRTLQSYVDRLLERNARETQELIDQLILQLVFFSVTTFALLLFLSYWITRPVRDLTRGIHQLGTEGLGHSIEISGPEELRQLGIKLEWLRQQLKDAEQREQSFLRHISHEFKTPLSSLREGADLLAERVAGPLSSHQQEIIDIIRQNSIELQRLIENLIDYNQVPRQSQEIKEISLNVLWDEVLGHYLISLHGKSLRLELRRKVYRWVADFYKLRTALDNLLSNAVNYTPKGGVIEVVWEESSGNLIMDVANSGDPIPEEDVDKVFDPFFQSSARRTGPIKGSGLGLSVARECMESQGGSLNLVQHPRLAVCFRLTCPAQ